MTIIKIKNTIFRQYIQNPNILPGKYIISVKIQTGIFISSPGSIWRAAGHYVGPTSLSTLLSWFTHYSWQHNRHLCGRHCRHNCTRNSHNGNTQTANTFKQTPVLLKKMAYESKWNEISPSYIYPKNITCPSVHLNTNNWLNWWRKVPVCTSGPNTHLEQTRDYTENITGPETAQIVPDHWPKIAVITGEQAALYKAILKPLWTPRCTIVWIGIKL